jgi:hypothetical protein
MALNSVGSSQPPVGLQQTQPPESTDPSSRSTQSTEGDAPPPPPETTPRPMGSPPPPPPPQGSGQVDDETIAMIGELSQYLGPDLLSFSKLLHEIGLEMRKSAREDRESAMVAQMTALGNAADEVRKAALWRMIGGIVGGVSNMAAGAINLRGATQAANILKGGQPPKSGDMEIEMTESGRPPTPPVKSPMEISNEMAPVNQRTQGQSQLASGTGQILGAIFEYVASTHDQAKLEYDRQATLEDQRRQRAGDQVQAMQELLRDIQEKLSQVQQSQIETQGRIVA